MTIADAAQRARALDTEHSFIVQAPAGSGKTELLIQRYLALLARVPHPEGVVAITFTRKAAGEMRRRVVNALQDSALPCPEPEHEVRTWQLARAVRERSEQLSWDLTSNPDRLRIRTIDSLCATITRQMPWLSRLGGPPKILEDAGGVYAEAALRTIELLEGGEWSAAVATLLAHLDNNVSLLRDLLRGMLSRRDQWLRHVLGTDDRTREALEAALQRVIRDNVERARSSIPTALRDELVWVTTAAGDGLIAEGREGRARVLTGRSCLPGPDDLDSWLGIVDTLLTSEGGWRQRLTVQHGFPPSAKPSKQRCLALIHALDGNEELRAALASLRQLPDAHFSDSQWQALQALVKLLPVAAAQLQIEFRARGEADYAEVAMAAEHALGQAGEPTELTLALDYQIQHLLVDEFQDTSLTQFALLERLTAGWQRGDGRTIFLVGDPMQSIYRFREAEVGLFLKACAEGIGGVPLELLRLSVNFRSDRGIVDWVNESFGAVLPAQQDVTTGAVSFHACRAVHAGGLSPAVTVHPLLAHHHEAEPALVVELVRAALLRQVGSVAVLVRARSHLWSIIPALRAAGLRFRAVEIDSLAESPLIQDLTALTRALLHPADRIAWLAILRAPWCGLTLHDLLALAGDAASRPLWELLHEESRLERLSSDGRNRLQRVRSVIEIAFASRASSLRASVEGVWTALGGPACPATDAELQNARPFFNLLEELEAAGAIDLDLLQERIQKLRACPDPEADEQLSLMTIHKAKGLEFDVVIVPGLGRKVPSDEAPLMRWLELPRLGGSPDLLLAPIPASADKSAPTYDYLKRVDRLKSEHERGRLLYVAATRARSELHLIGHTGCEATADGPELKLPESSSLLRRLWPVAEPVFQQAALRFVAPPEPTQDAPSRQALPIQRLCSDWQLPPPPPAVALSAADAEPRPDAPVSFHWVGDTLRHVGTVVHQLLRRIAEDGLDRWDEARLERQRQSCLAALTGLGVPAGELSRSTDLVMTSLSRALHDERGRWLLCADHQAAACEYPICGVLDGELVTARIDRTFVDETGTRWVIDYKSSSHQGAGVDAFLDNERERYRDQLLRYYRLFGAMENRPVRLGLYFPLLCAWRELGVR